MMTRDDTTMTYNVKHQLEKLRKLIELDGEVLMKQIYNTEFTKATLQLDRETANLIAACDTLLNNRSIAEDVIKNHKTKLNNFTTHATDYTRKILREFARPNTPRESHVTGYVQIIYTIALEIKRCINK